jgi:hypothetical protein
VSLHETRVLDTLLRMNLTEDVFEQILRILERGQHSPARRHPGIPQAGVPQGGSNE